MKPRRGKTPAPAKMQEQQSDERALRWPLANFAAASVIAVARLLSSRGEPVTQRFGIRRETSAIRSLPEGTARRKTSSRPGASAAAKRSNAPQQRADSSHAAHSQPIEQDSRRHLHHRVRPAERAGKIAERNQRHSEGNMSASRETERLIRSKKLTKTPRASRNAIRHRLRGTPKGCVVASALRKVVSDGVN